MDNMLLVFLVFNVRVGVFLCFVCFRYVSCVPKVASVSRLSILYFPFGFLYSLFITNALNNNNSHTCLQVDFQEF